MWRKKRRSGSLARSEGGGRFSETGRYLDISPLGASLCIQGSMALDGAALIAEIEALESEQDSTGEVTGILSRLDPVTRQVGHLGPQIPVC